MIVRKGFTMRYCLANLALGDKTYKDLLANGRFKQGSISRAINLLIVRGKVKQYYRDTSTPNDPFPRKVKVFTLVQE